MRRGSQAPPTAHIGAQDTSTTQPNCTAARVETDFRHLYNAPCRTDQTRPLTTRVSCVTSLLNTCNANETRHDTALCWVITAISEWLPKSFGSITAEYGKTQTLNTRLYVGSTTDGSGTSPKFKRQSSATVWMPKLSEASLLTSVHTRSCES